MEREIGKLLDSVEQKIEVVRTARMDLVSRKYFREGQRKLRYARAFAEQDRVNDAVAALHEAFDAFLRVGIVLGTEEQYDTLFELVEELGDFLSDF